MIKCVIIDDDAVATSIIESYVSKFPELQLLGTANNGLSGKQLLAEKQPDLMFLDVEMPGLSGIELLQSLAHRPKVIITSAKKDYAAEGFDLDVFDYIVKPVTFHRFSKSMNKLFEEDKQVNTKPVDFLFLKENKKMIKVNINDILYIESLKDYIKVYTPKKNVVTKESLSQFAEKLPSHDFIQTHRSFIVAVKKIEAYSSTMIEINGEQIPIGRNFKAICQKKLNSFNL